MVFRQSCGLCDPGPCSTFLTLENHCFFIFACCPGTYPLSTSQLVCISQISFARALPRCSRGSVQPSLWIWGRCGRDHGRRLLLCTQFTRDDLNAVVRGSTQRSWSALCRSLLRQPNNHHHPFTTDHLTPDSSTCSPHPVIHTWCADTQATTTTSLFFCIKDRSRNLCPDTGAVASKNLKPA